MSEQFTSHIQVNVSYSVEDYGTIIRDFSNYLKATMLRSQRLETK